MRVRSPQAEKLREALERAQIETTCHDHTLLVHGASTERVSEIAAARASSCTSSWPRSRPGDLRGKEQQRSLFGIGSFAGVFSALAGIPLITGEFRFGTIRPTFLFTPRRSVVLAAKVAASLLAGIVFAVVGEALSVGVGELILNGRGISIALDRGDFGLITLGTIAGTARWGGIGVGLGMIVRNQVGAVIGLLAWGFVVENPLFALAPPSAG